MSGCLCACRLTAQLEAIDHLLRSEQHVLVTLATGAGKSLIFQMASVIEAVILRQSGDGHKVFTVTYFVIVPYQALGKVRPACPIHGYIHASCKCNANEGCLSIRPGWASTWQDQQMKNQERYIYIPLSGLSNAEKKDIASGTFARRKSNMRRGLGG